MSILKPEDFEGHTYVLEVRHSTRGKPQRINIDELQKLKPGDTRRVIDAVEAEEITIDKMKEILEQKNNNIQ